jgi:hypothetical protein
MIIRCSHSDLGDVSCVDQLLKLGRRIHCVEEYLILRLCECYRPWIEGVYVPRYVIN